MLGRASAAKRGWSRALGEGDGGEEGLVARVAKGVGDEEELGLESAKT